jgi:hypothetical protein
MGIRTRLLKNVREIGMKMYKDQLKGGVYEVIEKVTS